jgi:hypothetical protein
MSKDTVSKIVGAIGAVAAGVGGGLAAGPTGAVVGGLLGLINFLAGASHTQASVAQLLASLVPKKDGQ